MHTHLFSCICVKVFVLSDHLVVILRIYWWLMSTRCWLSCRSSRYFRLHFSEVLLFEPKGTQFQRDLVNHLKSLSWRKVLYCHLPRHFWNPSVLTEMTYWQLGWISKGQLRDFSYLFIYLKFWPFCWRHFHPEAINFSNAYACICILTAAACFLSHGDMQPCLCNNGPGRVLSRVLNHTG